MQKRTNNFYNRNDKNNNSKNQNNEENNYGNNKYDKYQLTEVKTYKKTKIMSPYIPEKSNFLVNNEYKLTNKQFIYESGKKLINSPYFFKNDLNDNKINKKNTRNIRNTNIKYNTEYNNENDELYYEIQTKIYKKVIEQFNNNLIKYCKKILSDEYSKFLNNFKIISLQNKPKPKPKTYKKKSIINKTIYKNKKTPDKFNLGRKGIGNIISPFTNYKNIPKENNEFINHKASVNNSKKKVIYSNYFNLNIFENNTNNKYIYSSKTMKPKLKDEFKSGDKNAFSQRNLSINTPVDLIPNNDNINIKEISNYTDKKNVINSSFKRNPNKTLTQPKTKQDINLIGKDNLKIDNKNSLVFINYSTKKKIIDKLQNIKLFRGTNNNDKNNDLNLKEIGLEKKKIHFDNLIKRLKNVAFFKHFEKFLEFISIKNKKEFLEILRQKHLINEENLEKKNEDNINNENNDNIEIKKENKLDEEYKTNKIDNFIQKDEESKADNIDNIKNIEINYETIEKKVNEQENINNIKCINVKDLEISDEKMENDKNINLDNNLKENSEINLDKPIDMINNNYNEKGKKEINLKEENIEDTNIDNQKQEQKNDIEKENELDFDNLNNSINKQNNEKENIIINSENIEEIKDNINKRNLLVDKIFKNILFKEKINIIRESLIKWKQSINEENNLEKNDEIENENEKDNMDIIDENIEDDKSENKEENKEGKRNIINIKTLFLDEVDDEEKSVIMEEMVFRFRTLLMLSCFKTEEYSSD